MRECGNCLLFSPRTLIAGVCIDGGEPKSDDEEACINWSPRVEECCWFVEGWCRGKQKWCWVDDCPAWDHLDYIIEPRQQRSEP